MNTTKIFGINSLTIYPITSDTITTYTLGAPVTLEGAKSLEVSFSVEEHDLTGAEMVLDTFVRVRKLTFSAQFAKLAFEALQTVLNSNITETGVCQQLGGSPEYFKLKATSEGTDAGLLELHLMKCKINAIPIKLSENDFSTFSISGTGIFTTHKFLKGEKEAPMLMDIVFEGA